MACVTDVKDETHYDEFSTNIEETKSLCIIVFPLENNSKPCDSLASSELMFSNWNGDEIILNFYLNRVTYIVASTCLWRCLNRAPEYIQWEVHELMGILT